MPIVLNVKSQVKVRFKIFYRLLGLFYIAFALNATIKMVFFFSRFLYILAAIV